MGVPTTEETCGLVSTKEGRVALTEEEEEVDMETEMAVVTGAETETDAARVAVPGRVDGVVDRDRGQADGVDGIAAGIGEDQGIRDREVVPNWRMDSLNGCCPSTSAQFNDANCNSFFEKLITPQKQSFHRFQC